MRTKKGADKGMLHQDHPQVKNEYKGTRQGGDDFETLREYRRSGREIPYKLRKRTCCAVADAFECLGAEHVGRANRMRGCGSIVDFRVSEGQGGEVKKQLVRASFCRERLCAVCQSLKADRVHKQLREVTETAVQRHRRDMAVLMTLTVRNCSADELGATVRLLRAGLRRMFRHDRMTASARGWFWSLEVTYNRETQQFHPHLHVLAMMKPEYAAKGSALYFNQAKGFEFSNFWGRMLQVDYQPIADIRPLRGIGRGTMTQEGRKSLFEVTKYCVKPEEILESSRGEVVALVEALHGGLAGVVLQGYGGEFRRIRRELKLSDEQLESDWTEADDPLPKGHRLLGFARYRYDRGRRDYVLMKAWRPDGSEVGADEFAAWQRAGPG